MLCAASQPVRLPIPGRHIMTIRLIGSLLCGGLLMFVTATAGFAEQKKAPTVPFDLVLVPVRSPGVPGCALKSSSPLPDMPFCMLPLPWAPPRTCGSAEVPCANTGPARTADMASAIAEVLINFIHFSQIL